MGKRGAQKGVKHVPWTDEEWAAVRWAEDNGIAPTDPRLGAKLPRRDQVNIWNAVSAERRRRLGKCSCGGPNDYPRGVCAKCREKQKVRRAELLAQGLCTLCGDPIDRGGTTTICSGCKAKRRKYRASDMKKGRKALEKKQPKATEAESSRYNMICWLGITGPGFLSRLIPPRSKVVDLFGGSGDTAVRISLAGHTVLGWNDRHPMLKTYLEVIIKGDLDAFVGCAREFAKTSPKSLLKSYQQAKKTLDRGRIFSNWQEERLAALFFTVARNVVNRNMRKRRIVRLKRLVPWKLHRQASVIRRALRDAELTTLDFTDAIQRHDGPGRVFLVDPPWPGASHPYEYDMGTRHRELVDWLLESKAEFIGVMQSNRDSLIAVQDAPFLYWRIGFGGARTVIFSSFSLEGHQQLKPLDRSRFGYLGVADSRGQGCLNLLKTAKISP